MAGRLAELRPLAMGACEAEEGGKEWRIASARQGRNLFARFKYPSAMLHAVMAKVPEAEECLREVEDLDPRCKASLDVLGH